VRENEETMKEVVVEREKMLVEELSVSWYWDVVGRSLRILLLLMALLLGGLSVVLVLGLVMVSVGMLER
jgi:hypothetical protein